MCINKFSYFYIFHTLHLNLYNVQDPGNVGTIIRSALAFNVDTVVLSEGSVSLYNDKMIRSSEGTIFNSLLVFYNILLLPLLLLKNLFIFPIIWFIKLYCRPESFTVVKMNEGSVSLYNDKMIRSSEGTIFKMNVVRMNTELAIEHVY